MKDFGSDQNPLARGAVVSPGEGLLTGWSLV